MNSHLQRPFLPLLLVAAAAGARAQTVDYPSSALASPPQTAFPFYTPGYGSSGAIVRLQLLVPDAFLAAQSLAAGLVTRVGFSLAGQATYDVFELRAGATSVATLTPDWAVNLPDQRLQRDLGDTLVAGGGTPSAPVNQWVEFELDQPFWWSPGDNVVVDLTTRLAVAGVYCGTTIGNGQVQRCVNYAYAPGAPATAFSSNGVAVRLVFAPHELVPFGAGCARPGGAVPALSALGSPTLGNAGFVLLADQLTAGAFGGFALGFSRRVFSGGALPHDLGGGCSLLVAPDAFAPAIAQPGGVAALAFPLPGDPAFAGLALYAQFAQLELASPATVPALFSNGGIVSLH